MANPSKSSNSSGSKTMAELMANHQSTLVALNRGQEVKAKITKITSQEIFADVGAKTEALIIEKDRRLFKELLDLVSVGQEVTVRVINPESELGYPLVSLRKFLDEHVWKNLEKYVKSQEKLNVIVTKTSRGGFLVDAENGISGFLPNSHLVSFESAEDLVGKTIQASIIEANPETKRVIFSQKGKATREEFEKITSQFKIGQKVEGTISSVTSFGLFVNLETPVKISGLIHISEVSWEKTENLSELFNVGEKIGSSVIGFDTKNYRLNLSIKQLSKDPFEKIIENFPADKKVTGRINEITDLGIGVDLGENAEGFIRKDKISPDSKYEVDQEINATVVGLDKRKRKILLTPVLLEKPLMYR